MGFAPTVNLVEMRFFVTVDGIEHKLVQRGIPELWPLTPGGAATSYNFNANDATLRSFANAADQYWGTIDDFYSAADSSFGRCEFWAIAAGSQNALFITSHQTTVTPVNAGSYTVANEWIGTMRTITGRTMKVTMEEVVGSPLSPANWTADPVGSISQRLGAHMLDTSQVYVARDGSRPIGLMRLFVGQNEAIFKIRYNR